ncbi:MAG TPA: hypothetical protein VJR92_06640 [Gemmatimonadaceae bacterium]|nr:hypothetical protein [Gemmatimonadaceae bacterium]
MAITAPAFAVADAQLPPPGSDAAFDPAPMRVALTGVALLDSARRAQREFELFRRRNLPDYNTSGSNGPSNADEMERIGRFIYWYDTTADPPPPEPKVIGAEREKLIALLDSAATKYPSDDWVAGQRVRYLEEARRVDDEVAAARACGGAPWWCAVLTGFALHDARQYVRADSAFQAGLSLMAPRLRCDWTDVGILLDDYTRRTYRRMPCGSAEREQYEARLFWLSKPLYGRAGIDTRTEFYARMTMTHMLQNAISTHMFGFDPDERELLLRYGWPRAWSTSGGRGRGNEGGGTTGHEPSPSYQLLPPAALASSPASSDSVDWEIGVKPVHARYAPAYARRIRQLHHQSALFRRGDSSLVVLAWDVTGDKLGGTGATEMTVALARGDSLKPVISRTPNAPLRGSMLAKGPWGQLVMSAEFTRADADTAVRARYGLRPPWSIGARVSLSEMLFFAPYDGLPETVEEAAKHATTSIKLRNNQKLGVFFETYGTKPEGEKLKYTLTVAREDAEEGFMRRRIQAISPSRQATPLSITHEDISLPGAKVTARAFYLDVTQLKKGAYIVQLEVDVAGQYLVISERSLEIVDK